MSKTNKLTANQFTDSIYELDNFNEVEAARAAIYAVCTLIGDTKVSTAQYIYLLREIATDIEEVDAQPGPRKGTKATKAAKAGK